MSGEGASFVGSWKEFELSPKRCSTSARVKQVWNGCRSECHGSMRGREQSGAPISRTRQRSSWRPELKWVIIRSALPRGIVNVRTLSMQESSRPGHYSVSQPHGHDICVYCTSTTSPAVIGHHPGCRYPQAAGRGVTGERFIV